ncbi:MAG: 3-methyl-2-oxobutanoate dehydrogenase subunit beta, partial [Holophagales bacterium]|nr:3-methyl-2-oxobutanoate dehydrogenase subunit beta [Holophagales bacterium]
MGAHAMGIGAMVAGLDYFAGYPITPQTELLEYVAEALPEHGGVFQQL